MKVNVLVLDDDLNEVFVQGFIDSNRIIGYFPVIDDTLNSINVIVESQTFTLEQTKDLMEFLFDKYENDINLNLN